MSSFDIAVDALLTGWEPKIGRPTCGPGCSRCCERTTVVISSAEALRLLDFVGNDDAQRQDWRSRAARLNDFEDADAARNQLIDLGPCVFLDDSGCCGVYEARPDACRACHVWHPAEYCGREDYDMCTPAELNALRVERIHQLMIEELDLGRRPFWGQLLPMISVLGEHEARYRAGDDLRSLVKPDWLAAELIEFPDGRDFIESERRRLQAQFATEENPMGFPRAAAAPDRSFLAAFPMD